MEEWVGSIWHRFITRQSVNEFKLAQVRLEEVKGSIGILYRALGGDPGKRIEAATPRAYQQRRRFIQKIAGTCQQVSVAWQDEESVRLPPVLAVYPDKMLNRSLYLWQTALAAHQSDSFQNWAWDNQQQVKYLLDVYPGLQALYKKLSSELLLLRPLPETLSPSESALEYAVQAALAKPGSVDVFPRCHVAPKPIPLWLYPSAKLDMPWLPAEQETSAKKGTDQHSHYKQKNITRKRAERVTNPNEREGLLLFRLENLFSWTEYSHVDRCGDDSDDDQAERIAEDLDCLSVSTQQQRSAQLRIDLDLPAASQDDIPLGEGIILPEWDYHQQQLIANRCCVQPMLPKQTETAGLPYRLQPIAKKLRAHFERMRTLRCWVRNQPQGEELDLSAWFDFYIEMQRAPCPEQGLYQRFKRHHRDLACLLLADLSMSTDAYLENQSRVIDVVQDSLLLLGEALHSIGDAFAMYGFSSVKRQQVRLLMIKNFLEQYNDNVRGRILALKPGYYTRMGAAIRQMTRVLSDQPESKRLLLIITDGKPNDIDHYEGRFGIEDTRQAIIEAKQCQLTPFCITIDQQADDYLPYIFGIDGFTVIRQPTQLPEQLPKLYQQLTG